MGFFKWLFTEQQEQADPSDDMPESEPVVPQELLDAERRCPNVKFVNSCRAFFEKRGFLSAAQRRALTFSGTPFRRERQFGYTDYKGNEYDGAGDYNEDADE